MLTYHEKSKGRQQKMCWKIACCNTFLQLNFHALWFGTAVDNCMGCDAKKGTNVKKVVACIGEETEGNILSVFENVSPKLGRQNEAGNVFEMNICNHKRETIRNS